MFTVLELRSDIGTNNAMIIISMVVSLYYGAKHENKFISDNYKVYNILIPIEQSKESMQIHHYVVCGLHKMG